MVQLKINLMVKKLSMGRMECINIQTGMFIWAISKMMCFILKVFIYSISARDMKVIFVTGKNKEKDNIIT